MDLTNITFEEDSAKLKKELKEKVKQLPDGFRNMEESSATALIHMTGTIEINFRENVVINIPTSAQDIKTTSYKGEIFTEFYYKKTNYLIRF